MKKLLVVGVITLFLGMILSSSTGYIIEEKKTQPKLYIDGPANGKAGKSYTYTFVIINPKVNEYYLFIDWGDSTTDTGSMDYESNYYFNCSHIWDECGTYSITAKAKDEYDAEYSASLRVTMPKNIFFYYQLYWLLERFPILFKLVQFIGW